MTALRQAYMKLDEAAALIQLEPGFEADYETLCRMVSRWEPHAFPARLIAIETDQFEPTDHKPAPVVREGDE